MIPCPADAGIRAANDDDVTAAVDLLHAIASGAARPLHRGVWRDIAAGRDIADRVTAVARMAR